MLEDKNDLDGFDIRDPEEIKIAINLLARKASKLDLHFLADILRYASSTVDLNPHSPLSNEGQQKTETSTGTTVAADVFETATLEQIEKMLGLTSRKN